MNPSGKVKFMYVQGDSLPANVDKSTLYVVGTDTKSLYIGSDPIGGGQTSDNVDKTAHKGDGAVGSSDYQTTLAIDHNEAPNKDLHPGEFSFDVWAKGLLDPIPEEQINIVPFDNFTSAVPSESGSGSGYIGPPDHMDTDQVVYIYAQDHSSYDDASVFNVVLCNHVNDYITNGSWINLYVNVGRDGSSTSSANYVRLSLGDHVLYSATGSGVTLSGAFQYNGETTLTLELKEHRYAYLSIGITYSPTGEEHPTPYDKYYYYGATKTFQTTYTNSFDLYTSLYLYDHDDGSWTHLSDVDDHLYMVNMYTLPEPAPESENQWGYTVSFPFYYRIYDNNDKLIEIWSNIALAAGTSNGYYYFIYKYDSYGENSVVLADDNFNFNNSQSYGFIAYYEGEKVETLSDLQELMTHVDYYYPRIKSSIAFFYTSETDEVDAVAAMLSQCEQDQEKVYYRNYDFKTGKVKEKYYLIPSYNYAFSNLLHLTDNEYIEFYTANGRGTYEPDEGETVLVAKKYYVGADIEGDEYSQDGTCTTNDITVYSFKNFNYNKADLRLAYTLEGGESTDYASMHIAYNKYDLITRTDVYEKLEDYATKDYVNNNVQDSQTNGNILVHNEEIKVYDDSELQNKTKTDSEQTITNNPVSLSVQYDQKPSNFIADFYPNQNMNGFPKPSYQGNGRNKLHLQHFSTQTVRGVTLTFNSSTGTIELSGSSTSSYTTYIALSTSVVNDGLVAGTTYCVSGTKPGKGYDAYLNVREDDPTSSYAAGENDRGSGVTGYTVTSSTRLYLVIKSRANVNGVVIKPMAVLQSSGEPYKYDDFVPWNNECPIYTRGTNSPTFTVTKIENGSRKSYLTVALSNVANCGVRVDIKQNKAWPWKFISSYNGETLPSIWISSREEYAEGSTPTTGANVAYLDTNAEITPSVTKLDGADFDFVHANSTVYYVGQYTYSSDTNYPVHAAYVNNYYCSYIDEHCNVCVTYQSGIFATIPMLETYVGPILDEYATKIYVDSAIQSAVISAINGTY